MEATQLLSSAVVAAFVSGSVTYLTQRRLLDRKAQVDYEANARRRLYEAIGPPRLQLLFAARDVASRVQDHPNTQWNMNPSGYYGRSFIYRLLRPLAIGSIIERQVSFADFSVDTNALEFLKFNVVAYRAMTGGDAILEHPEADWGSQSQHVFRENLSAAAATLVTKDAGVATIMDFSQFTVLAGDTDKNSALSPLVDLFKRCKVNLCENPVFWLRLVAYAYTCVHLVRAHGTSLGFEKMSEFSVPSLLNSTEDLYIRKHLNDFPRVFDALIARGL